MSIESADATTEDQEKEPKIQTVEVDFLRHGESTYKQRHAPKDGKVEDLTELGKEQIQQQAEFLAQSINPENEIVVLWSSPAWRAQDSTEIIERVFTEKGIEIAHEKAIPLMRQIREKDLDYMDNVWQKAKDKGVSGDVIVTRDPEFQQKSDKFESYPEIQRRSEGVYNWIRYIAEKIDTEGKKLHIIGVGHMEFLEPIMEQLFDFDVEKGEGIGKGEVMKITFVYNQDNKKMEISSDFRGQHKTGITFDKDQRKFLIDEQ